MSVPATRPVTTALSDPERQEAAERASDRVLGLVPLALDVIETQLRTLDPDTKRELALRVLDEASVTPRARAKAGLTLGGEGDSISPLVASALQGAFRGLGEALGIKVTAPAPRDVTPAKPDIPPPSPRKSRTRPALSKGEA